MRPETTGDTEKGRSIRVMRKLLPRKSNLVIAHDAVTPKIMFKGTAMAATSSVSFIAESASGSATASYNAPKPLRNASTHTTASRSTQSCPRTNRASVVWHHLEATGTDRRYLGAATAMPDSN